MIHDHEFRMIIRDIRHNVLQRETPIVRCHVVNEWLMGKERRQLYVYYPLPQFASG